MIPPRTILAVVNFSDASRVALALAARLARHCGAELHVLHVEDRLLDAAARRAGMNLASQTLAELTRFIADVWPAARSDWQSHVVTGEVVDVILEVAHRHHADLIVVGSRKASRAERLLFGSTSEALLRRLDVSILVAPATWLPPHPDSAGLPGLGPLVVAVEVTETPSVAAATVACALAQVLGTSVEIVPIVPDSASRRRWRSGAERVVRARIAAGVQKLEILMSSLSGAVPVKLRGEAGALSNWLAPAGRSTLGDAPILILGGKTAGGRRGLVRAMASQVLSAAVPVLVHISDQAMWM